MSDSVRPHRWQPTRLPHPWDSPGKNTGVGCHFHLQCMKVKSEREVAQSCPTLSDPEDCSLPGFSAQGIFQARGLECPSLHPHKIQGVYKDSMCECSVIQSCLTLCDPTDTKSLLGSSFHGIFQARILEGVAISFSRGS